MTLENKPDLMARVTVRTVGGFCTVHEYPMERDANGMFEARPRFLEQIDAALDGELSRLCLDNPFIGYVVEHIVSIELSAPRPATLVEQSKGRIGFQAPD